MVRGQGEGSQNYFEARTGILLVEDEELLRTLVADYLAERGFCVYAAQDGVQAVQLYREHEKTIQIVFSDIDLPNLNGVDAFRQMRAINPDVQVIFASGSLNPLLKKRLHDAGVKYVLQKPYSPEEIVTMIGTLLGK